MTTNASDSCAQAPTRVLADFCAGVRYWALPETVVHKAKLCILDYLANIYGSLSLGAVQQTAGYIRSLGSRGRSRVLGLDFTTDIHHAAFINGTSAEAIEAQDGVRFGGNHPGVAVIPAAFALAEDRGLSGKQIIEAIVAGYEAANRVSAAMHPWHTLGGFLPTGTCGALGAAAAAGRLMDLDGVAMAAALGNAGYVLPVSTAETLMGGYTVKIVQGGQGASCGLMAAGLAERGVTGAPYILEGSHLNGGFTKITTAADPDLNKLTANLGEPYSMEDVYFKPYTACRHTHGAAQAALGLRREHGLAVEQIESVRVFTYGIAELAVGKPVAAAEDQPPSFVSAQFSIPWVVAACLADGELGPAQVTENRLEDRALLEFSNKIQVATDEALNAVYPEKTATRVEIRLQDGSTFDRQVDIPKGDPRDPMTQDDIIQKIMKFCPQASPKAVNHTAETILSIENMADIRPLAAAMDAIYTRPQP
ncbi:MAG: MmgE/PrpD family protein [Desulfobacter sp.]|nr:MAG: MmgE/PrpD family protein [Desulfobacter sp.]